MRLIDAEELLKILQEQQKIGNVNDSRGRAKAILEVIHAPTVEAEPVKHGTWTVKEYSRTKWIPEESDGINEDEIGIVKMTEQKCSICQRWTIKFTHHIELDFCPYCGARMDGDTKHDTPHEAAKVIITHYGAQHQLIKLCEECGKLIQQAAKCYDRDQPFSADFIEELADVEVLIMQFRTIMGAYWFGELERTIYEKLERQLDRIDSEGE